MVNALAFASARSTPRIENANLVPIGFLSSLLYRECCDEPAKLTLQRPRVERYRNPPIWMLRVQVRRFQRENDGLA